MSIGEGFRRHGDGLPLPQLLQFHVGISTHRYGTRDHFVVVIIAKKGLHTIIFGAVLVVADWSPGNSLLIGGLVVLLLEMANVSANWSGAELKLFLILLRHIGN